MKFSGSLLENKDIGLKLFGNSVHKTKTLLKDIFNLDLDGQDKRVIKVFQNDEKYSFDVIFILNGREISVELSYVNEDLTNDIVSEVLCISESNIEFINISGTTKDVSDVKISFWSNVMKIQDYIEKKFEINFTPIDLQEKDKNVLEILPDEKELTWAAKFTQDHHEGTFEANYQYSGNEQLLKIIHNKHHKIYLD